MNLILASLSPRRAELLRQIGLSFQVAPSHVQEGEPQEPFEHWVQELAMTKALAAKTSGDCVVLAADTIVVCENRVLGKPADEDEANAMLKFLSGKKHQVLTGVCVVRAAGDLTREKEVYRDVESTRVWFRTLSEAERQAYVSSGEPLDKAGAYGIQGLGALLVERIEGCYFNVVGLPLVKTMQLLRRAGFVLLGQLG